MIPWIALAMMLPAEAPEARFLEALAREANERARYEEALVLFSELLQIAPDPVNVFNAAVTAEKVGQDRFAFSLYERYLTLAQTEDPALLANARRRRDRLARRLALIEVSSRPPGARITVDGLDHGLFRNTPATLALDPGRHVIRARLPDHHAATGTVTAVVGESSSIELRLPPHTGRLRVELAGVRQARASLGSGGEERIPLEIGEPIELPVGRYVLTVDAPGYELYSTPVVVPFERTEVRNLTLVPLPPATGRVLVTTTDAQTAELWIDGSMRAETPVAIDVPIGVRDLEVRYQGRKVWSERVLVIEDMSYLYRVSIEADS